MSDINTISETTLDSNGNASNGAVWSDSRDALKKIVADTGKSTLQGVESLNTVLQNEFFTPFINTFAKAANAHEALLTELRNEVTEERTIPWKKVLKYRRGTQERVITPLNARMGMNNAEQVHKRFSKYFAELQAAIQALPTSKDIPEPPNLYEPRAEDTAWIRIRKSHVRRSRAIAGMRHSISNGFRGLLGREKVSRHEPMQHIDVRELLQYHVQMRVPTAMLANFNKTHKFLSFQAARYEKTQNHWSYELLEAEQTLAFAHHEVEELDAWIAAETASTKPVSKKVFEDLLAVGDSLQTCLADLASATAPVIQLSDDQHEQIESALYQDFKSSGTFLLEDRSLPYSSNLPAAQMRTTTDFWKEWYREVNNRLQMNARLHELRDFLLRRQDGLLNSMAEATIIPILNSFSRLRDTFHHVSEETDRLCSAPPTIDTNTALLNDLKPLHKKIEKQFKIILNDVSDLLRAGQALEEPGAIFWKDLTRFIEDLPELIDVHETFDQPVTRQLAEQKRYQIRLRELIQTALLVPLPRQLLKTAKALQKAVIHTWEETQQVEHMVDYNLKSAFTELQGDTATTEQLGMSGQEQESEEPQEDPVAVAKELIVTGLARSTEKLEELAKQLQPPWHDIVDQIFTSIQADSDDVLHDVREEDNMNDGWTNLKMKVNRFTKRLGDDLENGFERVTAATWKFIKNIRRRGKQLIKKGQTAVGVVDQSEDQWLATLELASDIDALHKKLPLVYRRLFSLKPLADLDLLEGRKLDVAFVKKHYAQWKNSQTGPLLLAMPDGSGRTSFMNVLTSSIFTDADVKPLNLPGRVRDDQEFADIVAEALAIEVAKPLNLNDLEAKIMEMDRGTEPCILVIDRFEHLLLCSPGGHELIERVLIFMSRTDNLIYWVINVSNQAWHFLEKTMSPSSGFISAYNVTRLQRQALEDIILKRHHRSGMSLHFRPNTSSKSFFEFPRSNSEEALQETYRSAFFDRLHRLAGQNILLALLYWLRAVEFDAEKDTLFVNSITSINFSFLDTLDLPRVFTLKSFLTHGTLTLEEHQRVFKQTHTESTFILESLLNLRIIEPTTYDPSEPIHFRIEANQPYRLHPLIVHPVMELLKRQHIVY